MKRILFVFALCLTLVAPIRSEANEGNNIVSGVIKIVSDGEVRGQVFTFLGDVKTPLVGKISLTDGQGHTISTSQADESGNFVFQDVEPGSYKAIGVAGDYIGGADVEVLSIAVGEADSDETQNEEFYTAIPLAVAPAQASTIFDTYASLPAASFSQAPSMGVSSGSNTCCGGFGVRSLGGSGGCCGGGGAFRGSFNFRRLALLGGAIALPIALSGDDDMVSPVE